MTSISDKHSQRGGVKVVRDENGKIVPTCDQQYIVREAFHRVEMLNLFVFGSSCSIVFKGTLSNVMLRSQRGLSQTDAHDCLENVRKGDPVFDVVFKISIVDDEVDEHERWHFLEPFKGKSKVTITTKDADREVDNQITLYERLSCVNTDGAFVPDVVGHHMMEPTEFANAFKSLNKESRLSHEAGKAFEWIVGQLRVDEKRKVDIIIMELADGAPVATLPWIDSRHGSLGTAACAVVAATKGDGFVPSDLHPSNTVMVPAVSANPIPTLIDFGRWWIISRDEPELMSIFQILLKHNLDVPNSSPITLRHLCHFFLGNPDEFSWNESDLQTAFKAELDFLKTGNDACCFKLQGINAFKNTHRTLTMIAFIDFLVNRCKNNHDTCQFAHSMEHVYFYEDVTGVHPEYDVRHAYGGNTFKNFPKFLERCTPDYDRFFAEKFPEPKDEPDKYKSDKAIVLRNLQRVNELIKLMIASCPYGSDPSVTCAGSFRFKPPPMEAMEVDADPIQAMAFVPPRRSAKSQPPKSQPPKSQPPKSQPPKSQLPKSQPPKSQPPKSQPRSSSGVAKPSRVVPIHVPNPQSDTAKPAPVAPVCEKKKGKMCAIMGGTLKRRNIMVKRSVLKRSVLKRSVLKRRTHKNKSHKRNRK